MGYLLSKGISGVTPLSGAADLATEYLIDRGYADHDERVDSLINWETSKNFTLGFITGLGGVLTLPLAIPAALGASWLVQARMVGAIAHIYGHRLEDDRVRTMILLSLVGDAAKEAMKPIGIRIGQKLTERAIAQIPGRALVEVNKQIGFQLLAKAGGRGVVDFSKAVPLVGGMVGGSFDAIACRTVGRTAKRLFRRT